VLGREGVNVKMMSQGASKTNISLIVCDSEAASAVRALHHEFFESNHGWF
jgi:aspartate kinase